MNCEIKIANFQTIIEKLTPESQTYLLNLANMAMIAEDGKKKQLLKHSKEQQTA